MFVRLASASETTAIEETKAAHLSDAFPDCCHVVSRQDLVLRFKFVGDYDHVVFDEVKLVEDEGVS